MSHRSVVIRGERVRLYRSRRDYWFANQGDRTFVFYPDDAGWHLAHEPANRMEPMSAGTGRTMQQAVEFQSTQSRIAITKRKPSSRQS